MITRLSSPKGSGLAVFFDVEKLEEAIVAKKVGMTVRDDQGRTATVFASCQFDACMKAKALWPTSGAWTAVFVAGAVAA